MGHRNLKESKTAKRNKKMGESVFSKYAAIWQRAFKKIMLMKMVEE